MVEGKGPQSNVNPGGLKQRSAATGGKQMKDKGASKDKKYVAVNLLFLLSCRWHDHVGIARLFYPVITSRDHREEAWFDV